MSVAAVSAAGAWREVLLVAVPEELVFRGAVQGEIERRSGRAGVAIAGAAALFALAHLLPGAGPGGLLTFFPGCLFGWLRWRSGSLATAMAAHGVANVLWTGFGG